MVLKNLETKILNKKIDPDYDGRDSIKKVPKDLISIIVPSEVCVKIKGIWICETISKNVMTSSNQIKSNQIFSFNNKIIRLNTSIIGKYIK